MVCPQSTGFRQSVTSPDKFPKTTSLLLALHLTNECCLTAPLGLAITVSCADPESFFRGGRLFFFFFVFLVDEGIKMSLKAGRRRPASETPFQWRFAGAPMMAQH